MEPWDSSPYFPSGSLIVRLRLTAKLFMEVYRVALAVEVSSTPYSPLLFCRVAQLTGKESDERLPKDQTYDLYLRTIAGFNGAKIGKGRQKNDIASGCKGLGGPPLISTTLETEWLLSLAIIVTKDAPYE